MQEQSRLDIPEGYFIINEISGRSCICENNTTPAAFVPATALSFSERPVTSSNDPRFSIAAG